MIKWRINISLRTALLFCLLFIPGCDKQINQGSGSLEGVISIGPICPVEAIPLDPACLPTAETYKAYPVSIWTSNGKEKIAQINPALDGSYKTDLYYGDYLVVLKNGQNGIESSNLPAEISIIPDHKTILDINIDTGIR